jgi:hypothetical protein
MGTSTNGQKVYTLEEVNGLVPSLTRIVARQFERRASIQTQLRAIGEVTGDLPQSLSVSTQDSKEVRGLKQDLARKVAEYQAGWREIESLGGVLKDARMGTVDFYGRVDDKLVWLSWRYGESEIRHYHALDDGFSGRRELRPSMRVRLLN